MPSPRPEHVKRAKASATAKDLLALQPNFDPELYKEGPVDIGGSLFAVFSADNIAAVHLLSLVRATCSRRLYLSSSLKISERAIGYRLAVGTANDDPHWFKPGVWRLGAGSPLELLLCPRSGPSSAIACDSIDSLHASIYFHPVSGALMVRSMCERPLVYLDGSGPGYNSSIRRHDGTHDRHVLFMEHNRLRLGSYDFALDFVLKPKDYKNFERMRNITCRTRPTCYLDPVPSSEHYLCGKVVIHRKLERIGHTSHYSGVNLQAVGHRSHHSGVNIRSGDLVMIIMLRLTPETSDDIRHEVARLLQCSKHEHVVGIKDCWCEHGESWPCGLHTENPPLPDDDTIYYTTTLLNHTFASFPWEDISPVERESYFHQTLVGLDALHRSHVVHGSISPSSLTISRVMGMGLKAEVSFLEHDAGVAKTGMWTAPEILDGPLLRTKQADIWGLAMSWIHTFKPFVATEINEKLHRTIIERLDKLNIKPGLRDLIKSMTQWDSEERPSAEVTLAHPAWDLLKGKRAKEKSGGDESPVEAKRVRLMSPGDESSGHTLVHPDQALVEHGYRNREEEKRRDREEQHEGKASMEGK